MFFLVFLLLMSAQFYIALRLLTAVRTHLDYGKSVGFYSSQLDKISVKGYGERLFRHLPKSGNDPPDQKLEFSCVSKLSPFTSGYKQCRRSS